MPHPETGGEGMSIETKYKCDRCGWEQASDGFHGVTECHDRQIWTIAVVYVGTVRTIQGYSQSTAKQAHWCRNCMDEFGGIFIKKQKDPPKIPDPTIDDYIREIIREEVREANR
jgi:hypothetical protein